ncbi:Uncharacterised protein [Chromobacterium violaceum]|uniref:Uncharacterized protein n=1 Tax=Chromobacterium violaceum TaxID=536 RepID=A0A3S4LJB1_CHRVL|nr:Uncharacterised protein [Chromobacterium violaceum]
MVPAGADRAGQGKIRNLDDAALAINTIVIQGEGIQTDDQDRGNLEGQRLESKPRPALLNARILPRHQGAAERGASAQNVFPGDGDGSYAHYFKFGEIFHGRELMPDLEAVSGWSYNGAPVRWTRAGSTTSCPTPPSATTCPAHRRQWPPNASTTLTRCC